MFVVLVLMLTGSPARSDMMFKPRAGGTGVCGGSWSAPRNSAYLRRGKMAAPEPGEMLPHANGRPVMTASSCLSPTSRLPLPYSIRIVICHCPVDPNSLIERLHSLCSILLQ